MATPQRVFSQIQLRISNWISKIEGDAAFGCDQFAIEKVGKTFGTAGHVIVAEGWVEGVGRKGGRRS